MLAWLEQKYPTSKNPLHAWELSVLSSCPKCFQTDLIICSDVVEHIVDPDELLNFICQFSFKYLVISTPDREKLLYMEYYGSQSQSGPPVNFAHVREWSFSEFEQYVGNYFDIVEHRNFDRDPYCQVIIAKKKNQDQK